MPEPIPAAPIDITTLYGYSDASPFDIGNLPPPPAPPYFNLTLPQPTQEEYSRYRLPDLSRYEWIRPSDQVWRDNANGFESRINGLNPLRSGGMQNPFSGSFEDFLKGAVAYGLREAIEAPECPRFTAGMPLRPECEPIPGTRR